MQNIMIYQALTRLLSPAGAADVLAALRQDAMLWSRLAQPEFFKQVAAAARDSVQRWNPGTIALLALGSKLDVDALRASPMTEPGSPWLERSMQAYQSARSTPGAGPTTLEEAALLALALRERRRRAGNWSGITAEIQLRTGLAGDIHAGWRTAIAILNALVPDPDELLKALLPHQTGRQSFEWAVHARLCQPAALSEQLDVFSNILKTQPLEIQSGLLRSLNLHGRSNLAMALAEKIATDHPAFASLRTQTNLLHLDLTSVVTRAFMLHQLGSLYQVAGNRSQSLTYLHSAESTLKHWLAGLYLQELNLTPSGEGQELRGEDRTSLILSAGRRLQDEVGVALAGHPGMENVVKLLTDDGGDPMLLLIRAAQLNEQGEVLLAHNLASQGVKRLVERVQPDRAALLG